MAPSPITLIENNMASSLRYPWGDTLDQIDPKSNHIALSKRNSTPVGLGLGNLFQGKLSNLHNQTYGEHSGNINTHRALDRSLSEPIKPQVQPPVTSSSRYKTELCRPFAETGFCKYGEKCQFAHGSAELRNMPRHPKYKTELCRTFHTTGLCGYGTRCHFIHNAEERRLAVINFTNYRGQDDEGSLSTPPASISGSSPPTSVFFGDSFLGNTNLGQVDDGKFPFIGCIETPPVSPVESLSDDIESLTISSPELSDSPSPPLALSHQSALAYMSLSLRLPIFESLKEERL